MVRKATFFSKSIRGPLRASLAQAKGNLATAGDQQLKPKADEQRAIELFKGKVISAQERDAAIAAAQSNKANVEADEAAVRQAEINLGYTKITAPVDGIVGIATAQVGDLVGPATGTLNYHFTGRSDQSHGESRRAGRSPSSHTIIPIQMNANVI